jgi:hypothetical protein
VILVYILGMKNTLVVTGLILLLAYKAIDSKPVKVVWWEKKGEYDYVLKVLFSTEETYGYRGGLTVFHTYPDGIRCNSGLESWLSDRMVAIRWEEERNPRVTKECG